MAISLIQATNTIFVPYSDTTFVSGTPDVRSIDIDFLHNELRTLETLEANAVYEVTHDHVTTFDLDVIVLQRVLRIIGTWVIEFEDTGSPYAVQIIGGNSNVDSKAVVNCVSVRSFNTAGAIVVATGSGVLPADIDAIEAAIFAHEMEDSETFQQSQLLQRASAAGKIEQLPNGDYLIKSKDLGKDRIDGSLGDNNSRNIDATDSS